MSTLTDLAIKYDVDKHELGFLRHYERRFDSIRHTVTKVLEIGVETGRSHRMWLEYFPNATIYGFDIFQWGKEELDELQKGNPNLDRSVFFKGDQTSTDDLNRFLEQYGTDFDIIIDDGGHTMRMQQTTMKILFDAVKSGGTYVIEDLHTCSGEWPTLYDAIVIEPGDTLTTDLLTSIADEDTEVTETKHLNATDILNIRSKTKSCSVEIGVQSYTNPKRYTYKWPTLLSFMELN
jgi:hypothetical protein